MNTTKLKDERFYNLSQKLDQINTAIINELLNNEEPPFDLLENRYRLINIMSSMALSQEQIKHIQRSNNEILNKLKNIKLKISQTIQSNHKNLNLIKRYNRANIE